jgi:hypothetical protein
LNEPEYSPGPAPEAKQRMMFPREHLLENVLTSPLSAQRLRSVAFSKWTSSCLIMATFALWGSEWERLLA